MEKYTTDFFFSLIVSTFNSKVNMCFLLTAGDCSMIARLFYVWDTRKQSKVTNKRWRIYKMGGGSWLYATSGFKTLLIHFATESIKAKYSGNTIYCNECLQTSNLVQKLRAVLMHRLLIPRQFVVSQSSCLRQKLYRVLIGLVCWLSE